MDKKKPGEHTVHEVAQQFGVSSGVVYYWIAHKIITARRLNHGSPYWITIHPQKEQELENGCVNQNASNPASFFVDDP